MRSKLLGLAACSCAIFGSSRTIAEEVYNGSCAEYFFNNKNLGQPRQISNVTTSSMFADFNKEGYVECSKDTKDINFYRCGKILVDINRGIKDKQGIIFEMDLIPRGFGNSSSKPKELKKCERTGPNTYRNTETESIHYKLYSFNHTLSLRWFYTADWKLVKPSF